MFRRVIHIMLGAACLALSASTWSERGGRTSLDEAVSDARDRYPGRVLSAETRRRDGRESHKIRILTDEGRVKRLDIDADSRRGDRRRRR